MNWELEPPHADLNKSRSVGLCDSHWDCHVNLALRRLEIRGGSAKVSQIPPDTSDGSPMKPFCRKQEDGTKSGNDFMNFAAG
jgi:hypothetical protein